MRGIRFVSFLRQRLRKGGEKGVFLRVGRDWRWAVGACCRSGNFRSRREKVFNRSGSGRLLMLRPEIRITVLGVDIFGEIWSLIKIPLGTCEHRLHRCRW